jgi:RNA-directed DNA polymerase
MEKSEPLAPGRRGTEAQGTRCREGDAGHDVSPGGTTGETSGSPTVSTKLRRIAEQAARDPRMIFTTLMHLIDVDFLEEAYRRTRKDGAPGVDGVTARQYAVELDANLRGLLERMRSGRYAAPPVERVWIEKEDGKQRPIGKPTFEDKVAQRAVTMLLEAVWEGDFRDCSYGFRPRRNAHQALHRLKEQCGKTKVGWIVDADVSGFFDNLDHALLRQIVQRRVNDGGVIRFIGKWLNAGVLEDGALRHSDKGTPQGGVISPMLSNIFLHHVLDEWFVRVLRPRLKGQAFLVRFADDFVVGCTREDDARKVLAALQERFEQFRLTIHPEKTKLVRFRKPRDEGGGGNGTFDLLGFTHYWSRSLRGFWVIKRKTAKKRLRRAMKSLWQWCRLNRHEQLKVQHAVLCSKLRGHYQYYGVRFNYRGLDKMLFHARRAWQYWLRRRCHKDNTTWDRFKRLLVVFPLPRPRIVHDI